MTPVKKDTDPSAKKLAPPRDKEVQREIVDAIRARPIEEIRAELNEAISHYIAPQAGSGFSLSAQIFSATLEGGEIHAMMVFEGWVERPEGKAVCAKRTQVVKIPFTWVERKAPE